jgi:hypothetical protein
MSIELKKFIFVFLSVIALNIHAQQTGTCTAGTQYCESLDTTNNTTTNNTNTNTNTNVNTNVNTNANTNVNTSTSTNVNTNVNTNQTLTSLLTLTITLIAQQLQATTPILITTLVRLHQTLQ